MQTERATAIFTDFSSPTSEARKKMKSFEQPSEPKKYAYHGRNFSKVHFMAVRAGSRSVLAWLIPLYFLAQDDPMHI